MLVGAGAAGAAAASALREAGFGGRILLVGREPRAPYDRTSLSKFVIAGDMPPDQVPSLKPPDFYAQRGIERLEARVTKLEVRSRRIELEDGRTFSYDAALVAPGGEPKQLDVPGARLEGVSVLRTLEDAETCSPRRHRARRQSSSATASSAWRRPPRSAVARWR